MSTKYMNLESSKTSDLYMLRLNLTGKTNSREGDKRVALSGLSVYYIRKNIKTLYRSNKFKISGTIRNEKFRPTNGSYSISNIQDYFEFIIKKHETLKDKLPI